MNISSSTSPEFVTTVIHQYKSINATKNLTLLVEIVELILDAMNPQSADYHYSIKSTLQPLTDT